MLNYKKKANENEIVQNTGKKSSGQLKISDITNVEKMTVELDNPYILIFEKKSLSGSIA